jgi:hypothetical protein
LLFVALSQEDMAKFGPDLKDTSHPRWNKLQTNVLHEGETTGHKHEVMESTPGTATLLARAQRFLSG